MKIQPIIDRLIALCPNVKAVKLANGVSTADTSQLPLLYVHPALEEGSRSSYDNLVVQNVEVKFSVMIATGVLDDELDTIRDEVRLALLGHVMATDYDAIEYDSGELLEISGSTAWWRDTFVCNRYVRQTT